MMVDEEYPEVDETPDTTESGSTEVPEKVELNETLDVLCDIREELLEQTETLREMNRTLARLEEPKKPARQPAKPKRKKASR